MPQEAKGKSVNPEEGLGGAVLLGKWMKMNAGPCPSSLGAGLKPASRATPGVNLRLYNTYQRSLFPRLARDASERTRRGFVTMENYGVRIGRKEKVIVTLSAFHGRVRWSVFPLSLNLLDGGKSQKSRRTMNHRSDDLS
ncbi:hypothetical protein MGYG_05645 [Nannizzia gypsea CBS 118893]|uniref:Uncharacterized protein n=1 Tax=Arthroderma gypseum (strain ATCC MYA-4604 / CBS 118893) TaxID=535722 RepID=E4UX08_ARTGP|nr:hypothetical protein MGYG_05645 [Nannizzia gypsea CBS 118893]EFR02647.1 hypothetical protein MGYG_05645 [Nannizzia gypsea CBS 118893]